MTLSTRLRDRDAIVTDEDLIFRVYGYAHPPNAYVCDPEYAPETIYKTTTPRALRKNPPQKLAYYKFFFDQGLRFVQKNYQRYTIAYAPLQTRLVGVKQEDIKSTRNPQQKFQQLIVNQPDDLLLEDLQNIHATIKSNTGLSTGDFGVFGSLLHGFYHPEYSDLDLVVYGRKTLETLQQYLQQVYNEKDSRLKNEFESEDSVQGKHWRFKNYTAKEYVWHQQRKHIYALFRGKKRVVKAEFEPVKKWEEISNEYNPQHRITWEGWIKAQARITDDKDAAFMPSIYQIEPLKKMNQTKPDNIKRVLSYVEEFRMQAKKDEIAIVEGNLEKVSTLKESFHQITLTYGPRYYEQVLKVVKPES
jgi:predicted nucleotidyltransferase